MIEYGTRMLAAGMSVGLTLMSEGVIAAPNAVIQSRPVAGQLIDASVCRPVSGTRERILIRSVRPSVRWQVNMNVQTIVRHGELLFARKLSPVWDVARSGICTPRASGWGSTGEFVPRVLIYSEGEPAENGIELEFPDHRNSVQSVRVRYRGAHYEVDVEAVRYLLSNAMPVG
jgi:hypothetical protein